MNMIHGDDLRTILQKRVLRFSLKTVALLFFTLGILSFVMFTLLLRTHFTIQTITSHLEQNIFQTRMFFVEKNYEILNQDSLKNNLRLSLTHSLHSQLKTYIDQGLLDELQILTKNCDVVAASHTTKPFLANSKCLPSLSKPTLQRITQANSLSFVFTHILEGSEPPVYLVSQVYLDNSWLNQFPGIKKQIEQAGLIWTQGTLQPHHHWQGWFIKLSPYHSLVMLAALLFCIAGSLTLIIHYNQTARRKKKTQLKKQSQNRLISELLQQPIQARSPQQLIELLIEQIQNHQDMIRQLKQMNKEAQHKINNLTEQLTAKSCELDQLADLSAMSIQLRSITPQQQQFVTDVLSSQEDLADIVNQSLLSPLRAATSLLNSWQQGCQKRGTWRYLRHLTESPSQENSSLFDQQFSYLIDKLQTMRHGLLAVSTRLQTMRQTLNQVSQISQRITELSGHAKAERCPNVVPAILDAQKQLRFDSQDSAFSVSFINTHLSMAPVPSDAPKSLWVSAIFLIYKSLLSRAAPNTITTLTRLDPKKKRLMIIIENSALADIRLVNKDLWGKAQLLLARYDIQLSTLSKSSTMMISWHSEDLTLSQRI